jgi:hypothetical protein
MFRLSLTSATGWRQITEYRPEYQGLNAELSANCLTITFTLPPSAPAITEYGEYSRSRVPDSPSRSAGRNDTNDMPIPTIF